MKTTTTFDVLVNGKQYLLRIYDESRARCFEVVNGDQGPEVAATLNFSGWTWRRSPVKCIAAQKLPLVTVDLQPSAVPAKLEKLDSGSEVVFRDASNQYDIITTAEGAKKLVQDAIERRQAGVINIHEAGAMLAKVDGGEPSEYVDMLQDAALDGHLELVTDDRPMRAIDTKARADFLTKNGLVAKGYIAAFGATTLAEINRCLDRIDTLGVIARLPVDANTIPLGSSNPRGTTPGPAREDSARKKRDLVYELERAHPELRGKVDNFLGEASRPGYEDLRAAKISYGYWDIDKVKQSMRKRRLLSSDRKDSQPPSHVFEASENLSRRR